MILGVCGNPEAFVRIRRVEEGLDELNERWAVLVVSGLAGVARRAYRRRLRNEHPAHPGCHFCRHEPHSRGRLRPHGELCKEAVRHSNIVENDLSAAETYGGRLNPPRVTGSADLS